MVEEEVPEVPESGNPSFLLLSKGWAQSGQALGREECQGAYGFSELSLCTVSCRNKEYGRTMVDGRPGCAAYCHVQPQAFTLVYKKQGRRPRRSFWIQNVFLLATHPFS